MKKIAVLLLAFAPLLCSAAGKSASATMQVSFTVTEACTVQSKGKSPEVHCAFETPFQVQAKSTTTQETAVAAKAPDGDQVVVYF